MDTRKSTKISTLPSVPSSESSDSETLYTRKIAHQKQADVHSQGKCATTIDVLVDDVLLEIFDLCRKMHYEWPYPNHCTEWNQEWNWFMLVHVCRKWRQIIFDSPHRLNLRILCTYRTPVRKNLGIWPAFPIDILLDSTGGWGPNAEDNAIAALEYRDRVNSVTLFTTTDTQMEKIAAVMQEPFPVLTRLCMRSCEDTSILSAAFLGRSAPCLQAITLHRIPFPAFPTLLLSTSDLVTLNLSAIPMSGYISPQRMVVCLSALPRLEVFAIAYQDVASRPRRMRPPPVTRPILPVLTKFSFVGAFEYLEDLVARIDTSHLERVSIIYLDRPDDFQITQFSDFIDRSILGPSVLALFYFLFDRVTFTLTREYPNSPGSKRRFMSTTISYDWTEFEWRLPDVARVFSQFSAALRTVVHLQLGAKLEGSAHSNYAYDVDWLHLIRQFPAMQTLYVSPKLAPAVVLALQNITVEMAAEVLPSLGLICLEGEPASSLEKNVAIRQFSDHPITVVETTKELNESLKSYVRR